MPVVTDKIITFASAALADDRFFLSSLHGHEVMSHPYEFELALATTTPLESSEIDDVLQRPVTITLDPDGPTQFHGVVRAIETIPHAQARQMGYVVTVVPRLWYLTQTVRSRVFLDGSITDILNRVLTEAGLESGTDFDIRCSSRHPVRDVVVQYEESDLDFLHRGMEREGIFYFFTHEGAVEKLVISDANSVFEPLADHASVNYRPAAGTADLDGAVQDVRQRTCVVPRKVFVRDYETSRPATVVQNDGSVPVDASGWPGDRTGHGLQVLFGEHVPDGTEASRIARLRAEEYRARRVRYDIAFDVPGFHPGHKLTVAEHFVESFNEEYVLLSVEHTAEQHGMADGGDDGGRVGYSATAEAIVSSVVYRPPMVTPRPRVYGVTSATVDGNEPAQHAPIDIQGRYRLVLPFDTIAAPGKSKATIPVRMAQPYAGPGYGMHFPLHQGAEVLLAFVDGDPDRPVIVGAMTNPQMVAPITAPHTTRGAIYTRSQIRIEYDDDA